MLAAKKMGTKYSYFVISSRVIFFVLRGFRWNYVLAELADASELLNSRSL
jgi:hypothetical protein